jgi:hypothetical protein
MVWGEPAEPRVEPTAEGLGVKGANHLARSMRGEEQVSVGNVALQWSIITMTNSLFRFPREACLVRLSIIRLTRNTFSSVGDLHEGVVNVDLVLEELSPRLEVGIVNPDHAGHHGRVQESGHLTLGAGGYGALSNNLDALVNRISGFTTCSQ